MPFRAIQDEGGTLAAFFSLAIIPPFGSCPALAPTALGGFSCSWRILSIVAKITSFCFHTGINRRWENIAWLTTQADFGAFEPGMGDKG